MGRPGHPSRSAASLVRAGLLCSLEAMGHPSLCPQLGCGHTGVHGGGGGGAGKHLLGSGTLVFPCLLGLCEAGPVLSWDCGGASGVACWVLVAGRAGRGGGRRRGESHPSQARRVGGCVLSCEALSADGAAVMLCGDRVGEGSSSESGGAGRPGDSGRSLTCSSQGTMQPSWNRWLHGSCRTRSPSP